MSTSEQLQSYSEPWLWTRVQVWRTSQDAHDDELRSWATGKQEEMWRRRDQLAEDDGDELTRPTHTGQGDQRTEDEGDELSPHTGDYQLEKNNGSWRRGIRTASKTLEQIKTLKSQLKEARTHFAKKTEDESSLRRTQKADEGSWGVRENGEAFWRWTSEIEEADAEPTTMAACGKRRKYDDEEKKGKR